MITNTEGPFDTIAITMVIEYPNGDLRMELVGAEVCNN